MSVHLHIDRLVLEGTSFTSKDGDRIQVALRNELTSLLQQRGLHPALAGGVAVPGLSTSSQLLDANPSRTGVLVAQSLADSLSVPKS